MRVDVLALVLVLTALALAAGAADATRACTADEYTAEQFAQWDSSGDGLISAAEVEASIAAILGLDDLAQFPPLRANVRAQYRMLDTTEPPDGLDATEFAAAAWVRCGHSCQCTAEPNTVGPHGSADAPTRPSARRLGSEGVALPGSTGVPGLWHEIASLDGDLAGAVQQMTLFNSNQLRATVKVWLENKLAALVADVHGMSSDVLESVICGGVGQCNAIQLQIISGVGGLFGAFIDLPAVFLARIVMYVVPSFSLVQTLHTRGSLSAQVPSIDVGPVEGVPTGGQAGSNALLDIVVLLHVVPGADATINRFLTRTAALPMWPAVALAHLAQDGGFELDFSIARVISSPGSIARGAPVLDVALESELTAVATAYEEVFEFDDLDVDGIYDAGEPIGTSFKLGEIAWEPITHTTSDGSCMTQTDLSLLDVGTLRALCSTRGLPMCASPGVEHAELVAYLEANPVGCSVDVQSSVLLIVESRTAVLPQHPDFAFSVQFVTSTRPLQNAEGTIVAPNRAKVSVEIQNFPFTLPTRPRLAIKTAHAGAAPRVDMRVLGSLGLDVPFDLSGIDLSLLDSIGTFPGLPSFPSLPSLPSFPAWPVNGSANAPAAGGGASSGLPGWIPSMPDWRPWSAEHAAPSQGRLLADAARADGAGHPVARAAGAAAALSGVSSRLVASQPNSIEVNRDGSVGATSVYSAAAAAAVLADPSLIERARALFGGDIVATLLANASLSPLPGRAFAAAAYSTWDEHVVVEANGTRRSVRASALGTAGVDIGSIGGLAASFFAGVNATASKQFISFDTNSDYILWDPAVGIGERPEWRKARADAAAGPPSPRPGDGDANAAPARSDGSSAPPAGDDGVAPGGGRVRAAEPVAHGGGFGAWLIANVSIAVVVALLVVLAALITYKARHLVAKAAKREASHSPPARLHSIPTAGAQPRLEPVAKREHVVVMRI